ncbi:hypothetical protein N0V83_005832 [Neocucurbitaria cava]|uniref:Uncharacterized protein n=1 Tax=Neocucurbitaria cava TaxID=798079 RepID=A0A9W8Y5U9_9PLEO|nr:hypothetical protein N0V83_005832 [Neocucurbitaria cava]
MSYADYSYDHDSRHYQRPRHDFYYPSSRDTDAYSRHAPPSPAAREKLTNMRSAVPLPTRFAAPAQHRRPARKHTWPPSPSVEDETAGGDGADDGEPPANTRGTVDQASLLDEIEHPTIAHDSYTSHDRRFVLVSDPATDDEGGSAYNNLRDRRRKSFAERGNMPHIKTDVDEPPVFTERVSTPYAYTKPQKESTAPSPVTFVRSPEPLTPSGSRTSPSVPRREARDAQKEQGANRPKPRPTLSPHDSFSEPRHTRRLDVFEDSDLEPQDSTHLRTERKPARYSFVKSDLQKEDMRTNLRDDEPRSEARKRDSGHQRPPTLRGGDSKGSSKDYSYPQSPQSSSSSLNSGSRAPKAAPVDASNFSSSRPPTRPSSPLQRVPSPKLPPSLRESPPSSRPSSRGNHTRPASPLSFSTTFQPPSPGRVPVTEADWHSTYPPVTAKDRSRPPSRYGRHETMPVPMPRIDVKSPSPSRPPRADSFLPYPVDDRATEVFMPPEEQYQFDHSTIASPRQAYPDSPKVSSSTIPGSPRVRDAAFRSSQQNLAMPEETTGTRMSGSNSARSQSSQDGRRVQSDRKVPAPDLGKPLPSCPRSAPSARDDWFSLRGLPSFDICPSCYEGVFADTPFSAHFSQTRLYQRPVERFCDFSDPWIRLAWLLTIKQRRQSLDLLYALADIAEVERPCPGDYEVSSDRVTWYGIPDQRDGVHVANFAVCSSDKKMIEVLFPSMRGHFTKIPTSYHSSSHNRYLCSLRTSSRRFPKYLDLLVELDAEAQSLGQQPNIHRFIQLARENAFKGECSKDKASTRKPWHFIPSLPEFTVCEECYDELVWPAIQDKSAPSTIPRLFNKTIQLIPTEDPEVGSSCCLYSPRMRRVWDVAVQEDDFSYLKRKAVDRKKAEARLARQRRGIMNYMVGLEKESSQWERARSELKVLEKEWAAYE